MDSYLKLYKYVQPSLLIVASSVFIIVTLTDAVIMSRSNILSVVWGWITGLWHGRDRSNILARLLGNCDCVTLLYEAPVHRQFCGGG